MTEGVRRRGRKKGAPVRRQPHVRRALALARALLKHFPDSPTAIVGFWADVLIDGKNQFDLRVCERTGDLMAPPLRFWEAGTENRNLGRHVAKALSEPNSLHQADQRDIAVDEATIATLLSAPTRNAARRTARTLRASKWEQRAIERTLLFVSGFDASDGQPLSSHRLRPPRWVANTRPEGVELDIAFPQPSALILPVSPVLTALLRSEPYRRTVETLAGIMRARRELEVRILGIKGTQNKF